MTPLAYRRAVALAHACKLGWAAFALGLTVTECTCDDSDAPPPDERGMPRFHRSAHCRRHNPQPLPVPARIEDLHAPYLEDCKRRAVKPGPLPTLLQLATPITNSDIAWRIDDTPEPFGIGHARIWLMPSGTAVDVHTDGTVQIDSTGMTAADLARLSALVTAVTEVSP